MTIRSINTSGLPQGVLDTVNQLLFDASQVGGNLSLTDFSKIWQDSAGTTPYTAVEQYVGKIVDKSPNALAFTQATSAARPVVSARVNLTQNAHKIANWTDGNNADYADYFGPGIDGVLLQTKDGMDSTNTSVYSAAKANDVFSVSFLVDIGPSTSGSISFNLLRYYTGTPYAGVTLTRDSRVLIDSTFGTGSVLSSSMTNVSGDIFKISFTGKIGTDSDNGELKLYATTNVPLAQVFILGKLQITTAADAHLPYQRVNTPTDYDTAGFPDYAKFDGIDDNCVSAAGGGGTAGIYYCGAVRFNKVGAVQTIFSDAGTNSGYKLQLTAANQLQISAGNGTVFTAINTTATFAAGDVSLCELWDDGTNLGVRLGEGTPVTVARPVVTAGTAQITIGKDNNAASSYAGIGMFEPVWRYGAMPNATQREAIRAICRSKAGIV